MNLVDSSGWVEFLVEDPGTRRFASVIADTASLLVPTIVMHEVVKVLQREGRRDIALMTVALMRQGTVVPLDEGIALDAALASLELRLPTADSIILATAHRYRATLWTTDAHFKDLPGVKLLPKP